MSKIAPFSSVRVNHEYISSPFPYDFKEVLELDNTHDQISNAAELDIAHGGELVSKPHTISVDPYPEPTVELRAKRSRWWRKKLPVIVNDYDPTNPDHFRGNAVVRSLIQYDSVAVLDQHFNDYMNRQAQNVELTTAGAEHSRRDFLRATGKMGLITTAYGMGATGWSALGVSSLLKTDQTTSEFFWPSTKPQTHELPHGPETVDLTHGTFVFGGYGVKNSSYIAEALRGSLGCTGSRLYGIEYDNAGLQINDLAVAILKEIENKGLSEVSFYGHSMGGDVALLVAVEVMKLRPNVRFRNIFLDCTPANMSVVRSSEKGSGEFMSAVAAHLNLYGGPITRMAIELYNSHLTLQNPIKEFRPPIDTKPAMKALQNDAKIVYDRIGVIIDEKLNGQAMSNRLGIDEFDGIRAMDVTFVFKIIHEYNNRQLLPLAIRYIRPLKGILDATINVDTSQEIFTKVAKQEDIDFAALDLDSDRAHHADPRGLPDLYNPLIKRFLETQQQMREHILSKAYPNMIQSLMDAITQKRKLQA